MRAVLIGANFYDDLVPFFPGLEVITSEKDYKNLASKPDVVILSGGEDINPMLYSESPKGARGWNNARDLLESEVLKSAIGSTKVFGICRGLQMLNVYFSGNLVQNMVPHHGSAHPLEYIGDGIPVRYRTPYVNSVHHQCAGYITEIGRVLAQFDGSPEVIAYQDYALGVQFHPEWMHEEFSNRWFSLLNAWVTGEISFNNGQAAKKYHYTLGTAEETDGLDQDELELEEEVDEDYDNGEEPDDEEFDPN